VGVHISIHDIMMVKWRKAKKTMTILGRKHSINFTQARFTVDVVKLEAFVFLITQY
jgi:hypothetical protein